jgi:hypothetical protein
MIGVRFCLCLATTLLLLGAGLCSGAGMAPAADDPCAGFSWNVTHERTLFATQAQSAKAGTDPASAPLIAVGRLYELTLAPQEQIHFPVAPGRKARTDRASAGLVSFHIEAAGLYRVSADQPLWIDVASGAEVIHSVDSQGAHGCNAPHKVVQFMLPARGKLILQLSSADGSHVRVAVTAAPATAH